MAEVLWRFGDSGPINDMLQEMHFRGARHLRTPWVVQGISIGGCVDAVGTGRKGSFRRKAHAHTQAHSVNRGWVCFLSANPSRVMTVSGRPTRTMWHEWAHIAANTGHSDKFRMLLIAVGNGGAI